ncbi:MAG: hypothetical protein AAB366_01990 [Patescibacteria group bacterium]
MNLIKAVEERQKMKVKDVFVLAGGANTLISDDIDLKEEIEYLF